MYRSSYKNARRLAATETNMAYRTADYERWQQLDFVVGIEIRLSNNHTLNGKPFHDICDELAGRYPKDFKFNGWHPLCRCHAVTILKTEAELQQENQAILKGEEPAQTSVNSVTNVPKVFRDWLADNADRIKTAKSIPYFMRDNGTMQGGVFTLKEFKQTQLIIEYLQKEYSAYDDEIWHKAFFDDTNGGFLVIDRERLSKSTISKNETAKFNKELFMAKVFANNGYKVEMLNEIPRISSPDVRINGITADLKKVSGENNIVKYADRAIKKQKAEAVLFQFDKNTERVHLELLKLKQKGYKVFYFFTGKENKVYEIN